MVSPDAQLAVACIGGVTALMAGIIAMTQNDLKRVLAYSTISQLGYMFLALGTGTLAGIVAAMFHLFTHAFFKALLFLGAGSVMHGMGNVIDMRRFGGLRQIMPITCVTFAIGSLALAGIPPLSGFYSKDAILGAVHDRVHEADYALGRAAGDDHGAGQPAVKSDHPAKSVYASMAPARVGLHRQVYQGLYWMGLVTAFLTAFYTFRAFFMTFFGPPVVPEEAAGHAHESPPAMWMPLAGLSFFAIFVGFLIFLSGEYQWFRDAGQPDAFAAFLAHTPSLAYPAAQDTTRPGTFHAEVAAVSMMVALAGVGVAAFLYLGDQREIGWLTYLCDFGWLRGAAELKWLRSIGEAPALSTLQRGANTMGVGWLTRGVGWLLLLVSGVLLSPLLVGYYLSPYKLSLRKFFFDELYDVMFVWPLRFFAGVFYALDRLLVDGLVNLCGRLPVAIGGWLRRLHGGLVPFYGLAHDPGNVDVDRRWIAVGQCVRVDVPSMSGLPWARRPHHIERKHH